MTTVLQWFNLQPGAIGPAIASFLTSLWKSASTLAVGFIAEGYSSVTYECSQGSTQLCSAFANPHTVAVWASQSWWPFLVALFIVPLIQGGRVARQASAQIVANPATTPPKAP
jgi:hypothetical protein